MTRVKTVRPSPSFTLAVPEEAREDDDQRVSSFWIDGQPLLLQLSSYLRYEGVQVDARTWIHTYLVWPHLTIHTTVSGPKSIVSSPDNWARHAVASIALAVH